MRARVCPPTGVGVPPGLPRRAYSWGVGKFLLVIILFAAIVYATFWLHRAAPWRRHPARRPASPPRRPTPRTIAPDDDEDFLRDLNRRYRRRDQDKPNRTE